MLNKQHESVGRGLCAPCVFKRQTVIFFGLTFSSLSVFTVIWWFNIHFLMWDIFACLLIRMQWWSMRNRDWGLCGVELYIMHVCHVPRHALIVTFVFS